MGEKGGQVLGPRVVRLSRLKWGTSRFLYAKGGYEKCKDTSAVTSGMLCHLKRVWWWQ